MDWFLIAILCIAVAITGLRANYAVASIRRLESIMKRLTSECDYCDGKGLLFGLGAEAVCDRCDGTGRVPNPLARSGEGTEGRGE